MGTCARTLTDRTAESSYFLLGLALIVGFGIAIRVPGLDWLQNVAPHFGFDFHPDVGRFIRSALDFRNERPGGYPLGMATHLFVLKKVLDKVLSANIDPVILLRAVSLCYGAATIALSGIIAKHLSNPRVGLLTATFLALSPLHVVNSIFGTADATATFWFYVVLLFGWRYLRDRKDADFVAFVASTGVSLATKFFIPLLVPITLVLCTERRRLERIFLSGLVLAGSFSIVSFFNYTPWDMVSLLRILLYDNVIITGGNSPLEQLWLYPLDSIRALGLATWLLFVVGLVYLGANWRNLLALVAITRPLGAWARAIFASPYIVPVSAFAAHAGAIVLAEVHVARHLLPFVPLFCFIAAHGFCRVTYRFGFSPWPSALLLVGVLAYQLYTVVGVIRVFDSDVRNELASQIAARVPLGEDVVTFSDYSLVLGTRRATASEEAALEFESNYFATCDLEYSRYYSAEDASEIFHAYGGQERLEFFRNLFAGNLPYKPVFEVSRKSSTLEEYLEESGVLSGLDMFTPGHCVLFERGQR
jgi:uncharacterized membrane protein